jgi:arsenite methyltransferase
MAQDLPVDPDALREQVRGKYREVAADPGASFHFHTGRSLAGRLGHDPAEVDALPDGPWNLSPGWVTRSRCGG